MRLDIKLSGKTTIQFNNEERKRKTNENEKITGKVANVIIFALLNFGINSVENELLEIKLSIAN